MRLAGLCRRSEGQLYEDGYRFSLNTILLSPDKSVQQEGMLLIQNCLYRKCLIIWGLMAWRIFTEKRTKGGLSSDF